MHCVFLLYLNSHLEHEMFQASQAPICGFSHACKTTSQIRPRVLGRSRWIRRVSLPSVHSGLSPVKLPQFCRHSLLFCQICWLHNYTPIFDHLCSGWPDQTWPEYCCCWYCILFSLPSLPTFAGYSAIMIFWLVGTSFQSFGDVSTILGNRLFDMMGYTRWLEITDLSDKDKVSRVWCRHVGTWSLGNIAPIWGAAIHNILRKKGIWYDDI